MSKIKNKLGCEKVDRLKLSRCLLPRRSSDTLFTKTNVTTGEPALFLVYSDGLVGRCLLLCLMPNRDWLRRASCSLVVLIKKLHRNSLPPFSDFSKRLHKHKLPAETYILRMIQNSTPSAPIKLELDLQYDLQNGYDWPTVSLLLRQSRLIQCDKQIIIQCHIIQRCNPTYLLLVVSSVKIGTIQRRLPWPESQLSSLSTPTVS